MVRPLVLAACLVVTLPGVARADDEQAVSVVGSFAAFSTIGTSDDPGAPPPELASDYGGSLTVAYERMFGTDLGLRAEGTGGVFHGGNQAKETATSYVGVVDLGVVAKLDILKYVPYGFAGVGGILTTGGPLPSGADFALVFGGGLDYLVSRNRSFGVEARVASFAGDVTVFTLGIRGTTRWGYF